MSYRFKQGDRVGRWIVVGDAETKTYTRKHNGYFKHFRVPHYYCICECGTTRIVSANSLGNRSTSCGCFARENSSRVQKTHGLSKSRLYRIWRQIKRRCYEKDCDAYKYYGGRGIKMDETWKDNSSSFFDWALSNGYREGLTIDRINNNEDYKPKNCRFITNTEQQRNRRNNINITAYGETKTLEEWSRDKRCKVSTTTIKRRILWGINPEGAISSPSRTRKGVEK